MPQFGVRVEGSANVSALELSEQPITIGRHSANVLVLADNASSRAHAVIEAVGDQFRIRDLNSSNGTFLNGQRVVGAALKAGDVIQIGATKLHITSTQPAPVSSPNSEPEDIEELSADDLVDGPILVDDHEKIAIGGTEGDYEESLETVAAALPKGAFEEHEIALVSGKGKVTHEAQTRARKPGSRRDMPDLLRLILICAFRSATTDVHFEPRKDGYLVRLRVDGTLIDACKMPLQIGVKVASMIKVIAEIDLAQRDSIQEGSFSVRVPSSADASGFRRVDYRLSFAPTVYGQKLVIRVLDSTNAPTKLQNLGLPPWMAKELAKAISNDAGMVLVAGPTGSGKTSTLYALVRSIDVSQRNVVTIEDPVEIQLEGVSQMPVNEEQGKSFSNILRSVLRQDPDVILVGEVRDSETARIAMQASITGHLVFSTVHTKDSAGTIFRLLDLGVEPYMISQGLHMVIAQRLVRTLCPHCKRAVPVTPAIIKTLGERHASIMRVYEPIGCKACLGTGHIGRRAIFELMIFDEQLRSVIARTPTIPEIQDALKNTQFVKLMDNGYDLVAKGLVSISEVERTVGK
jgi:general secretion pathway protein E